MKRITLILIAAMAVLMPLSQISFAEAPQQAPGFSLADINNNVFELSSYIGKQGVLLFFWTSWCPFCRQQLKVINDKYPGFSQGGPAVLGINAGEPAEKVGRFLKRYPLKYPVLIDESLKVAMEYHVVGVPTYVLIDKKGDIIYLDNYFPPEEMLKEITK
ncbi:MAG: TlpA disulfide reductase family protein [Candidatus Omnitrophota bacterium]